MTPARRPIVRAGTDPRLLLVTLAAIILSACTLVRVDMSAPVSNFRDTVKSAGDLIAIYYTSLNDYERDLGIQSLALSGKQVDLVERDARGAASFKKWWTGPFDPSEIAARVRLLNLLGEYADGLLTLSSDEEDQKLRDQFEDLGKSITDLNSRWQALGQRGLDDRAQSYVGPLTTLVGEIEILAAARNRDAMLVAALKTSKPGLRTLLDALKSDFASVVLRGHELGELQRLADAVLTYNGAAARFTQQERLKELRKLETMYESYQSFVNGPPTQLFPKIQKSFEALVVFVEADRTPQTYREIVAQLKALRDETEQLVAAAKAVHALTNQEN